MANFNPPIRVEEVDVSVLREAFLRSGKTAGDVARALGWEEPVPPARARKDGRPSKRASSARVTRALGMRPEAFNRRPSGHVYGGKPRRTTSYANAVKLAHAIGVDPIDIGL